MNTKSEIPICLSIIVPVLNERAILPDLASHLETWRKVPGVEVIFVDGGSTDGSRDWLEVLSFKMAYSSKGRAKQMSVGASRACGKILLFLHADTQLPEADSGMSPAYLMNKMEKTNTCWGRFDVCIEGKSRIFAVIAFFMNWRSRLTGIATGDQAIFATKEAFIQVGGFPDQALMEDIALSSRLLRLSKPLCLEKEVITSGRRWEKYGVYRTVFLMWRLRLAYWLGLSTDELAKRYP